MRLGLVEVVGDMSVVRDARQKPLVSNVSNVSNSLVSHDPLVPLDLDFHSSPLVSHDLASLLHGLVP